MDELERRLRARGTETEESLTARLETAAAEMRYISRYKYEIINQTVSAAVAEICQVLQDHKESKVCSKS